jgi:hypothetical protein
MKRICAGRVKQHGFRTPGFLGLIAGPILLNLLRKVLETDAAARKFQNEANTAIKE